jgi:hypothetical protein
MLKTMARTRIPAKPRKVTKGGKKSTQQEINIKIKALSPLNQVENIMDVKRIVKTLYKIDIQTIDDIPEDLMFDVVNRVHYAQDPYNVNPMLPKKVWRATKAMAVNRVHATKLEEAKTL